MDVLARTFQQPLRSNGRQKPFDRSIVKLRRRRHRLLTDLDRNAIPWLARILVRSELKAKRRFLLVSTAITRSSSAIDMSWIESAGSSASTLAQPFSSSVIDAMICGWCRSTKLKNLLARAILISILEPLSGV
jgi:hypothetical protein